MSSALRRGLVVALVAAAVGVLSAGCSSQQVAGWTFTPTQPVSAPPSAAPSAAAAASGGQAASGQKISLTAQGIKFNEPNLTATANQAFTISFNNQDAGIPHNVAIFQGTDTSGSPLFTGDLVTGPATKDYSVPALQAGTYTFICQVHPNMTGTITVK